MPFISVLHIYPVWCLSITDVLFIFNNNSLNCNIWWLLSLLSVTLPSILYLLTMDALCNAQLQVWTRWESIMVVEMSMEMEMAMARVCGWRRRWCSGFRSCRSVEISMGPFNKEIISFMPLDAFHSAVLSLSSKSHRFCPSHFAPHVLFPFDHLTASLKTS